MSKKLTIWIALGLIIAVLVIMVRDFYYKECNNETNPYEYSLDKLKNIDSKHIGYTEIKTIIPEIDEIKAIAIDKQDRVYVSGKEKIAIYSADNKFLKSYEVSSQARSIHVGAEGKIYLGIDSYVEVLDKNGVLLKKWSPVNIKSVITSIAESKKYVYVADAGNKVVYQYSHEGELIKEIGKKDSLKGIPSFVIPSPYFDLLLGRENELWVVNPGRHSFQTFSDEGELISSWERTSMQLEGFSGCCNPSHIAMLSNGSFVTSEKGIERIKIHKPSGNFETVVAGSDKFDEGTKGLDLAVDSKDRVFVLDPKRNQIRIFEKIKR